MKIVRHFENTHEEFNNYFFGYQFFEKVKYFYYKQKEAPTMDEINETIVKNDSEFRILKVRSDDLEPFEFFKKKKKMNLKRVDDKFHPFPGLVEKLDKILKEWYN